MGDRALRWKRAAPAGVQDVSRPDLAPADDGFRHVVVLGAVVARMGRAPAPAPARAEVGVEA